MPSLGFAAQFASSVESGSKLQSIRAPRKRPIKVGDWLALYTGMRQPTCRKLGEAVVESVEEIAIGPYYTNGNSCIAIEHTTLGAEAANRIARADGFASWIELADWFDRTHGIPFSGHLIRWRLLPRAEWRKT